MYQYHLVKKLFETYSKFSGNWDSVLSADSAYVESAKKSAKYFKSLGMGPGTHILCNGAEIPGLSFSPDEGIEEKVYEFLLEAVPEIQRAVYYGQIGQV